MQLKIKEMLVDSGGPLIAILNIADAGELGVRSQGRIKIRKGTSNITAIVNTTEKVIEKGELGIYDEIKERLYLQNREFVEVSVVPSPNSLKYIKSKLNGRKLSKNEIYQIIHDVVQGNLSDVEIASFVTTLHFQGLDLEETMNLSTAMVETGKTLKVNRDIIVDKHSIGGVPGDKTTLLVVPIVASCGLTIPKSSSRAITSAAGTADRAETLMPVDLSIDEMKSVVEKVGGCITWGGALDLSPADDIFIKVEFPLSIDPLLLPSILSKKKAVGAEILVIDIPCGWGAKIKTLEDAKQLAQDFLNLGYRLGITIRCIITYGRQPIGYTIGPTLEAKEALENLMNQLASEDLIDKATDLAGALLEMVGHTKGKEMALQALKSGKAEAKLREIIALQGGDSTIMVEDLVLGDHRYNIHSDRSGNILWMNNAFLVDLARKAGAPADKGAGIQLYKKMGDQVRKDDVLFTIYSEKGHKLENAISNLKDKKAMQVGKRIEMTMSEVSKVTSDVEEFILER